MNPDLLSNRARRARAGKKLGKSAPDLLFASAAAFAIGAAASFYTHVSRLPYICLAFAIVCLMLGLWIKYDLRRLQPEGQGLTERLSGELLGLLDPKKPTTPLTTWQAIAKHWHTVFILNRFLLPPEYVEPGLSNNEADMAAAWQEAERLSAKAESPMIEPAFVVAALLLTSPSIRDMFIRGKFTPEDIEAVVMWLGRGLEDMRREKPYFGGIGRDWANGFTPRLSEFGHNVSLLVEHSGSRFSWLADSVGVRALTEALNQRAGVIALIGPNGVGKTNHVYGLALHLLAEHQRANLAHKQIIELNSSLILSHAQHPGQLEQIVISLLNETIHAGHIILFLDDAHLFLGSGPGAFDISQILLPIAQSHAIQIILAITPNDYQNLRATNPGFAGLITPVTLQEPDEPTVMRILEDTAIGLESRNHHKILITYDALREAYRLSGRYEQDMAYPGKAVQLLEQSVPYAESKGTITESSVQKAIEQSRGVRVSTAAPVEANQLLNLEDHIHERMINQTRAVSVVAAALRRARAGVANPKRPIGSFLFLGPTGVGKTELAKSIAAIYFGSESSMIRLDMSEYQQPDDVSRLLSNGAGEAKSLILAAREQPFSVVLLDEIEKAHPNILNLLLQLLDEGQLTDNTGRTVSFKDCIIIATSNAGADEIRRHIDNGEELESFETEFTNHLIGSGQFKPELLNRFDEIVLFRPLNTQELGQVVRLMLTEVNRTLANQNIAVELTDAAIDKIVATGNDPRLGARPMRRALQRAVEDTIAQRILAGQVHPGDHVVLDAADLGHTLQ